MKLNWVQWVGLIVLILVIALWILFPDWRRWGAREQEPAPQPAPVVTEEQAPAEPLPSEPGA
jgi:hypothetical protein